MALHAAALSLLARTASGDDGTGAEDEGGAAPRPEITRMCQERNEEAHRLSATPPAPEERRTGSLPRRLRMRGVDQLSATPPAPESSLLPRGAGACRRV